MREIAPALTAQTTADTASVTDVVVTDTASVTLVDSNQHDPETRGGHFLCRAVRDARLYMGYF